MLLPPTYDWEKGQRNNKKAFQTEDAAARFFLEKVASIASMMTGHAIMLR